ncbi:MAG TPA: glycoside hydrolase family 76 protein [Patescibacteria group bacterium]|nr:glycoside hydrolase family 76 protein [Patescibacteria group bacterium]
MTGIIIVPVAYALSNRHLNLKPWVYSSARTFWFSCRSYRRGALGDSLLKSLLYCFLLTATSHCLAQTAAIYHARADQALQSFLLKFWNGGQQYLRNSFPDNGTLTGYWTYANGWDAVMDGVERSGGEQYWGLIESFYLGQDERGWFSAYYDDECWMGLALMRAYDLTHDLKYLAQAQNLYGDVMAGWDSTCCGPQKGGVWWDRAHTQKATAANAGAALLGARLYERTANPTYLQFAEQVYSFWYSNMVEPGISQVCDHINPDGSKVWWKFSYNEGLMTGAALALNRVTGDWNYVTNANRFAHFMVTSEDAATAYGLILTDGSNSGCGGDCHQFKGPAYRYLSQLYASQSKVARYYSVLKGSADSIWNLSRDTNSGIFSVDWAGPAQAGADQAQDNAACSALSRFAQIYAGYPGSGIPLHQYEAENAVLHHVQLEALYGSFTGWGYVAAWNGDGQWIQFDINCAAAGDHTLKLRYAAGAGNATRVISINGIVFAANQNFPATGSWTNYGTVSIPCNLPGGHSTIAIRFDSAQQSFNWLNLDNLAVVGDPPEQIRLVGLDLTTNGTVHLTWTAVPGQNYRIQYGTAPTGGIWNDLGIPVTATGATASTDDLVPLDQQKYYRVISP